MNSGRWGWKTRLISQVLCCVLFLQAGPMAAGSLPAPPDRREWVSDERLDALVKADLPMEVAGPDETPEPVRIAALQERPAPPEGISPSSILTDSATDTGIPAARPKPVEEREEPPAPVEIRPEDLPPFPPGLDGAVLPRAAASTLQALTAASLIPNWNLASVQNEPVDKSPASVFSSIAGKFTRVFAYNACTPADPWKVYDPADAPGSDLTQVDQKIGFWIEMTAPASVPNPGNLADETTIHLCVGWNLIGFPAGQARPVRTALSSIEGKYTRVFGFDPADTADPWEIYDVAVPSWANDLEVMQPGRGYWVLATAETDLEISNVGAEPEVAITAPANLGVVTAPTEVRGTVRSDRLQSWTLSYRLHGEADATVFATGSTPVVNGRLATFDPTLLLNGGYTIELTATDFNGQSSTVEVDVSAEGQMKVGNFTLAFIDVEIPMSGLPIQVVRHYDSRDKRRGDFGIGWTLQLKQGSYRNNRKPGDGWQISSGFLPCQNISETKGHVTTIRISDREIYRFRLRLASPSPTLGGCFAQARFDFVDGPVPGATLAILGNTQVIYQNDTDFVVDFNELDVYEPDQVRMTTRDGRVFDLSLQQGVTRIQDRDGNTLSITPGSITHSDGLSATIQRDGLGRITSITDPEGESLTYGYDAAGDLATFTDRDSNTTRFTYDGNHRLLEIEDPLGRTPVRNEYDGSGRLIRTTDASGQTIEFDHRVGDRQELVSDRLGHTRLLEYDQRGNVVREVDASGKTMLRTFDADDHLLSETDPLGNTTAYTYDANGNRTSVTDPAGNRTTFTYNSRGDALTTLDPRGKLTSYDYDANGNLATVTDALGNTSAYTYDSRGNALTETDPEGNVTTLGYDGSGRLVSETDALGHVTTYTYDRNGRRRTRTTTRTTAGGTETLTWTYVYDGTGRLARVTEPDGTSSSNVYDGLGNLIETVDKLGRSTVLTYDALGRLTETRFPDGTTEQLSYDAEGRQLSSTDRGARTTRYEYDAVGRLLKTVYPDGSFTTAAYDAAGRVASETDAEGNTVTYEYDPAGRRTKVRNALGQETRFAYNAIGNRTSVTDSKNQTTAFEYDDANRLTRIVFPDGTARSFAYDRLGRKISETDPDAKTTAFVYDDLGRLTEVTDALGQATRYGYDELGNRISQTDANGHVTTFGYDSGGRLTGRTLPLGQSEILTYDAAGNLRTRQDFAGAVVSYSYDINNQLIQRSYSGGASVSFTYNPTGLRASATDDRGTTSYSYDALDRLTGVTDPEGRVLSYAYDGHGNRTSLSAVVGAQTLTTQYAYDALNRLQTVVDPQGRSYAYGYDANGNRASLTYPNGVETTYGYDALNRLHTLGTRNSVGAVIQSYVYTLGPAGNRTRIEEADGTIRDYQYDPLYRLTRETVTFGGSVEVEDAFTYDPVGNRLTRTRTDGSGPAGITYTYDERDRILTENGGSYSWDANGNLLAKPGSDGATYVWNLDNRLVRVERIDGTVVKHAYDADGNRVRTEVTPPNGPPTAVEYLVDPSGQLSQVVAEIAAADNVAAYFVRGDDLLATIRPGGTRFFHADGLDSIRVLTDESANVTDRYEFSAFGELAAHLGSDPNAYLFAGQPLDPNSGFYYLRARWLDPAAGRFASVDPFPGLASDPITLHRYLYAADDPANLVDPSGEFFSLPSLSFSFSIQGVLQSIGTGALLGALFGAGDAYFAEEDVVTGAINGAIVGAFLGPLGRIRALQGFLINTGMFLAGLSAFDAYMDGDTGLALYRGIFFVAGARAVLTSGGGSGAGLSSSSVASASTAPNTGNVGVYLSVNPATTEVQYVGITQNFAARAAAHLRSKGIDITEIGNLQNLSRADARAVEQTLINYYALGKNGGTLLNKINSISSKNPIYAQALLRGQALLQQAGFPGF